MVGATDLKNGTTFQSDGVPFKVIKYFHQKIGRGGATVKLTVRNLESGDQEEKTVNSSQKFEEISTTKKQYLYKDEDTAFFMDEKSFEQIEIPRDVLGDDINYLKEGSVVNVLFWEAKPLSVEIAPKVILAVTETDPGVKGDTASNVYKSAKLENGINVKVPLFIKNGDKVRVDTRTGEYVERIKVTKV